MKVVVDMSIESPCWSDMDELETLVETAVEAALRASGRTIPTDAEVSCLLCDDAMIRSLNARWRGIDKATNVLSFPSPDASVSAGLLGDVVLAYETVAREAQQDGKTLADHVTHLVVHGCLHLVGFDHEEARDADAMEALEIGIMARLGRPNPYAERPMAVAK